MPLLGSLFASLRPSVEPPANADGRSAKEAAQERRRGSVPAWKFACPDEGEALRREVAPRTGGERDWLRRRPEVVCSRSCREQFEREPSHAT